ncbi:hypothetical protein [Actinacidiphila paucisporea]|uniref:Uncharacterized protein n=1 Tax=Actinacidiphila paucisporea TaxID=310782 RepID=A0A1M6UE43_9ACTN|nr:hypothetical protein [Actinacidiphila paucisporea]SHK67437.1 hypothetical protein SAMN05216499_101336 [Actinacidiphila paucisporea]
MRAPNRRDDEVRQLLDTPHPAVPAGLVAVAAARGRRTVRRRRVGLHVLWVLLVAAVVAGVVAAVLTWPAHRAPAGNPGDGTWWSPVGLGRLAAPRLPWGE